jgi:hypothetical protein
LPLDGCIRLGHAQVIRGGDTASLKFGYQRRWTLETHRRKLTLESPPPFGTENLGFLCLINIPHQGRSRRAGGWQDY